MRNVGKPSLNAQAFVKMYKFTVERNPRNNVRKLLGISIHFTYIKISPCKEENVKSVGKPSVLSVLFNFMENVTHSQKKVNVGNIGCTTLGLKSKGLLRGTVVWVVL